MISHEGVRLGTVIAAFVLGWGITIAGFFTPPLGIVDNSILFILGQGLTYCAAGIGLKDYVDVSINNTITRKKPKHENDIEI